MPRLGRCATIIAGLSLAAIYCYVLGSIASERYKQHNLQVHQTIKTKKLNSWAFLNATATRAAIFKQRRELLQERCENFGLTHTSEPPNAWEFFISHQFNLVWCNVFKAASSTWLYNFNLLGGYRPEELARSRKTPLALARERYPRPTPKDLFEALKKSNSFLIVREPFERLLSAYRNKLEHAESGYYKQLARRIVSKFRDSSRKLEGAPTFSEFINYVIGSSRHGQCNEHWCPIYNFCSPCQVNFTWILHTETLAEDQTYLLRAARLNEFLPPSAANRNFNRAHDGRRTEQLVDQYYSNISIQKLNDLYNIYAPDFHLFGYSPAKYFTLNSTLQSTRTTTLATKV